MGVNHMGRPKSDDGEVLLQALKTLKEPIQKQDIPDIITEINWGKNPIKKVERLLNAAGDRISRPIRGFYQYAEEIEEKVEEKVEETVQLGTAILKPVHPPAPVMAAPQVGDDFVGIITAIEDYGVFVEAENRISGLLHRTKMKNGIAPWGYNEIAKMFRTGDMIHSKIASINADGKISLTTQGMELPRAHAESNPIWSKLQEITTTSPTLEPLKIEIKQAEPKEPVKTVNEKETDQLITFLREKVGNVSPAAKTLLSELIHKHGMFNVMLGLTKTVENFEVDMGLLFVKEIQKKVSP